MRLLLLAMVSAGCTTISGLDDLQFAATGGHGGQGGAAGGQGGAGSGAGGAGGMDCEADLDNDPTNCGGCGWSCLGEECQNGRCDPYLMATGQDAPYDVEIQGDNVYWVNSATGEVMACSVDGCSLAPTRIGVSAPNSFYLAVTDEWVFWNNNSNNQIFRCPIAGCGGLNNELIVPATDSPTEVGADGTHVYWHSNTGTLSRSPHDGSQLEMLITGAGNSGDIEPRLPALYWSSRGDPAVAMCADVDDCVNTKVALTPGVSDVVAFAFDDSYVYYGTSAGSGDVVERVPLGGGTPERIADTQENVWGIALSDTHVYWVERVTGGSVAKRLKDGSGVIAELASYDTPRDIEVKDGFAYVTVLGTGEVVRLSW